MSLIVEVCKVDNVTKHPNGDNLDIVTVKGWRCINKKGSFKVGDEVVYFPPDSLLPQKWAEQFGVVNYLKKLGYNYPDYAKYAGRVYAAKLRGLPSFGVLVQQKFDQNWKVGDNVASYFDVGKWEQPIKGDGQAEREDASFHKYTHIENIKNFLDGFIDGEEVIFTEKIHGCLRVDTPVRLVDGTNININKIKAGDYVLGVVDGKVVPSKVLKVFNHGNNHKKWLNIRGTRSGAGRGNSYFAIRCTENHQLWSPVGQSYVDARLFSVGDKVVSIRQELGLTPIMEQVALGKMLGDGSLCVRNHSAFIRWGQKSEKYTRYTQEAFGDIAYAGGTAISGYGTLMHRASTICSHHIKLLFNSMKLPKQKKIVPEWVIDKLSPISIAFWYMDDGSLSHHPDQEDRASIAVCDFSEEDCKILQKALLKFGIGSEYFKSKNTKNGRNYSRLRLNSDDAEKLFLLIAPYIPDFMQYKLPERYRGHIGWMPTSKGQYKKWLLEQTITSIEPIDSAVEYDIETETHNFFANDILVHNSNTRVGLIEVPYDGHIWMAGSHNVRKKAPVDGEISTYWIPLTDNVKAMLKSIVDAGAKNVILFSEIYGAGVQDLRYNLATKEFRAFDLSIEGQYLDHNLFTNLCNKFAIPTCPILYRGPFSQEVMMKYTTGNTTLCEKQIREGIVMRPIKERLYGSRRCIFKSINDDYTFRKDGTEYH